MSTTAPDAPVNRGTRALALAGQIGLKGYSRTPPVAVPAIEERPSSGNPSSDRVSAILALPEARGRPSEARHLAHKTTMTVREAQSYLSAGRSGSGAALPVTPVGAPATGMQPNARVDRGARGKALAAKVGLQGYS